MPGVYAVGDVRANSLKRVASAVGEGSVVISDVHRYLAEHKVETSAKSALVYLRECGKCCDATLSRIVEDAVRNIIRDMRQVNLCTHLKHLGFTQGNKMRLYGEVFEFEANRSCSRTM